MKITIFTTTTCAYCAMVKKFLDMKQKAYEVVNLDDHPERQEEAFKLSGALTVPITHVENGDSSSVIIGYNLPNLSRAIS